MLIKIKAKTLKLSQIQDVLKSEFKKVWFVKNFGLNRVVVKLPIAEIPETRKRIIPMELLNRSWRPEDKIAIGMVMESSLGMGMINRKIPIRDGIRNLRSDVNWNLEWDFIFKCIFIMTFL